MSSVTISESSNNENDRLVAENIVKSYKNHPRVQLTEIKMTLPWNIFIQPASDQLRSLKEFESKESHWPSYYESYKISANIIDFHLANIINNDLSKNSFLNCECFLKIYEKFLCGQLQTCATNRSVFSTKHFLMRLVENWRTVLDKKFFTGAVLFYLPRAFLTVFHKAS